MTATPAFAQERSYDIPAESLSKALRDFGQASGKQIIFTEDLVRGKRAPRVKGNFTPEEALRQLLSQSGLRADTAPSGAIMVMRSQGNPSPDVETAAAAGNEIANRDIVVTGTHIRGQQDSAIPLVKVNRTYFNEHGYSSLEQVFRDIPQNFGSTNSAAGVATGNPSLAAAQNTFGSPAIDLRGLGPESTLVLLNGQRVAGGDFGRIADISAIPISLVERADILVGGDSAVYGADAVGGVVNLVTRRDFKGLEVDADYGFASDHGGGEQANLAAITGLANDHAGLVAAYSFNKTAALYLEQTGLELSPIPISGIIPVRTTLVPESTQHSFMLSGHVEPVSWLKFFGDGLYSAKIQPSLRNESINPGAEGDSFTVTRNPLRSLQVTGGVDVFLPKSWKLEAALNYGRRNELSRGPSVFDYGPGAVYNLFSDSQSLAKVFNQSIVADGPLPGIAGITPRLAIGFEHRTENLLTVTDQTGDFPFASEFSGRRSVTAFFGELNLPVFGYSKTSSLGKLEVNAAIRTDRYSDAGRTTNPQFGLVWKAPKVITVRSTYGTSFRPPSLFDYSATPFNSVSFQSGPAGDYPALELGGNAPNLRPEKAKTWTAGVELQISSRPNIRLNASYYSIRYQDRLTIPTLDLNSGAAFLQGAFPKLFISNPTAAQVDAAIATDPSGLLRNYTGVAWDPATGGAGLLAALPGLVVFDDRYTNIAKDRVRGIDFGANASFPMRTGSIDLLLAGTYTIDHVRQITPTSTPIELLDDVGKPASLRLHLNAGWTGALLSAYVSGNYVNGYDNSFENPVGHIGSWTTIDLTVNADLAKIARQPAFAGTKLSVSVSNLLNTAPPRFLESQSGYRFDATNANAVGRFVTMRLTKKW